MGVTVCPTYIMSNIELRKNKAKHSNIFTNLQGSAVSPKVHNIITMVLQQRASHKSLAI